MSNAGHTIINCVNHLVQANEKEDCLHERDVSQGITYDLWGGHVRLWFRGHADATWNLEPLVYRAKLHGNADHIILK
jgi:hypothetical protein